MKRFLALLTILMLSALVMSACRPASDEPADDTSVGTPTDDTSDDTSDDTADDGPFECSDEIGCVDIAAGEPLHIAYMLTTSGATEFLGIDSLGGIEIAIDERGDIAGHEIQLTGEDSGCSAEGGQTAAQKIAADPTVIGVIGTNCSGAGTSAIAVLSPAGYLMLSPTNTSPALTNPAETYLPGYFRTAHNDLFQGRVAAEFAFNELGFTTAAALHDGDPYTEGLATAFAAAFEDLGGTITSFEAVNKGDTDMRPVLTSIAADAPEVLYFPIFEPEGNFVAAQSAEVPGLEDVQLMGADGILVVSFGPNTGSAAEGMYMSGPYVSDDIQAYADFLATYEANTGGPPPAGFAAHAYDATNILLDAIESVIVTDNEGVSHVGRQALRDAVEATSGFEGLTGVLACADKELQPGVTYKGDCGTGEALAVFQITADQIASEDNWPPPVAYIPSVGVQDTGMDDSEDMVDGPYECTDELGCVEILSDEPIHLAYMLTTSGATEFLGADSLGGIEIAIDERGDIAGFSVQLTGEDSGCSAEGGQTAAQKVAADPTVVGVIGTNCSGAGTSAIAVLSPAGYIMVSPTNTSPALTNPAETYLPGYFRTAHNDLFQGRVAAEFAFNELGFTTAAALHDGDPYTEGLASSFAAAFEDLGGTITSFEAVNKGDTDMRPVLTSIAADAPEVLYFPIFEPEGNFVAAQSAEVPGLENVQLMGADGLLVVSFGPNTGSAAEGMYMSGPYVSDDVEAYADFLATYEANTGGPPPAGFAAHAYDATNILLDAIEAVAVVDGDGTMWIGRQALRDAVENTSGFAGLTGVLSCGDKELQPGITYKGDCATGEALAIFEITADQVASEENWPPEAVYIP